jgi:hypothetical protein
LGGQPFREAPIGVETVARSIVNTLDVGQDMFGGGVGAEASHGLDEAPSQGVGGVSDCEGGERVIEAVTPGALVSQPGECRWFRMNPDRPHLG